MGFETEDQAAEFAARMADKSVEGTEQRREVGGNAALAAARREGAEEMREAAARIADERAGGQAWKRGAAVRIAETIRALPPAR